MMDHRMRRGVVIALLWAALAGAQEAPPAAPDAEPTPALEPAPSPAPLDALAPPPEAPQKPGTDEPLKPQPDAQAPLAADAARKRRAWRGSMLSAAGSLSVLSTDPGALRDLTWTFVAIAEWHFGELFFARARMSLIARTVADPGETGLRTSDLYLYGGWSGFTEPHTGLKLSGDLLITLPTSFGSQLTGLMFSVGPRLALSRSFPVLAGLTVGYGARVRFYAQRYVSSVGGGGAGDPPAGTLASDINLDDGFDRYSGPGNPFWYVSHGPFVSFRPHETVSIDAALVLDHGWSYAPVSQFGTGQQSPSAPLDLQRLLLQVSWQPLSPLRVVTSLFTVNKPPPVQLAFVSASLDTRLFLELVLDIEGFTSLFL
jgi:hypothetical protein